MIHRQLTPRLWDGALTGAAWLDGEYRYWLTRQWGDGPKACWIMLNPSTADAEQDDPTIRRCISFSKRWGCGSLVVVNLFARRCTRPVHLKDPGDPVGPENRRVIADAMTDAGVVVAAWGAHPMAQEPAGGLLASSRPLYCLGKTKDGAPRHPLYVKGDAELVRWP